MLKISTAVFACPQEVTMKKSKDVVSKLDFSLIDENLLKPRIHRKLKITITKNIVILKNQRNHRFYDDYNVYL